MSLTDYSMIGRGRVHYDGRPLGNCSVFRNTTESEIEELQDFQSASGGLANSASRISKVGFALALHDITAENLATALRGSYAAVAGGAVTDESITSLASLDTYVPTAKIMDVDDTVTVTSDPAGTTFTVNTDYLLHAGGITILESGTMVASTDYLISYTAIASKKVQALTNAGEEVVIRLDGTNYAQTGSPFRVVIHRAKPQSAEENVWIGDSYVELAITGDALKDSTKTDPDSQYIEIEIGNLS